MHIVLADGSRTGLMIIKRMLDPRGDEVAFFLDGHEALDYILATPQADVLITSFEIGGISGTELCWEARLLADSGRPFYVIAMSSSNDPQHAIGVLDAGADDFMSKPPRPDELAARLRVAERTLMMQRRLIEMATIDALSRLYNRGAFREKYETAVTTIADDDTLSLVLFDIDHFKRINDVYGHDAGDEVIRAIGRLHTPPDTMFARIGGEEFAVVLPGIPIDGAKAVAEHLREQIAAIELPRGEEVIRLTASFGVAELMHGESSNDLYRRADSALYYSKNGGRNLVTSLSSAGTVC
jgi:diguanylate cyclase (GGDEF)-like protein